MRLKCPCGDIYDLPEMGDVVVVDGRECLLATLEIFLLPTGCIGWTFGFLPADKALPALVAQFRASGRTPRVMSDSVVGTPVAYEPPPGAPVDAAPIKPPWGAFPAVEKARRIRRRGR